METKQLYDQLSTAATMADLTEIATTLGIDLESLHGRDKRAKAMELVKHCQRQQQLHLLLNTVARKLPAIDLSAYRPLLLLQLSTAALLRLLATLQIDPQTAGLPTKPARPVTAVQATALYDTLCQQLSEETVLNTLQQQHPDWPLTFLKAQKEKTTINREQNYYAFMVRIWHEEEDATWRVSVEDPHSGARQGFATVQALFDFLNSKISGKPD